MSTEVLPKALLKNVRADEAEAFYALAVRWKQETLFLSSAYQMAQNAAYQEIIQIGLPAVPLILCEMRQKPGHWFLALQAITNENPAENAADFAGATKAWLDWGKRKGYLE